MGHGWLADWRGGEEGGSLGRELVWGEKEEEEEEEETAPFRLRMRLPPPLRSRPWSRLGKTQGQVGRGE